MLGVPDMDPLPISSPSSEECGGDWVVVQNGQHKDDDHVNDEDKTLRRELEHRAQELGHSLAYDEDLTDSAEIRTFLPFHSILSQS